MNKGLFDLSKFESMGDDDIISMNINENAEFANTNPDTNHPEETFDNDALSGNENQVSVPGGLKETPNAKPYDASEVNIPEGDNETPKSKPYDAASIPVPSKVTLTSDQYNDALAALKKSFKEGVEIMEMLENATVIETSIEDKQQEYVESMIADQLLLAYEDGPVFEAVKREDKDDVKSIVRSLRPKLKDDFDTAKIKFYKPNMLARVLTSLFIGTEMTTAFQHLWKQRLWQMVGICLCEEGNIKDVTDELTKKYESELGEYKILYVKTSRNIIDLFRTKFGWKNNAKAYFILIDKKIPKELAEVEEMVADAKDAEETKEEDKKED